MCAASPPHEYEVKKIFNQLFLSRCKMEAVLIIKTKAYRVAFIKILDNYWYLKVQTCCI